MLFENYQQLIANGQTPALQKKRQHILEILTAALAAVNPYPLVSSCFNQHEFSFNHTHLTLTDYKNIYLIGFGKASRPMVQAITDNISIRKGVIITNTDTPSPPLPSIKVHIGGHPLPNEGSITGTKHIISLLEQTTPKDLVITLISGGGSALLCQPRIPLDQMQHLTKKLLQSGADITEINTIRKHLSTVKGGQLIRHSKAPLLSLILSDIVNDPIEFIASGPTTPDTTTFHDTKTILKRYKLWENIPENIKHIIRDGINRTIPETPKPHDPQFSHVKNLIIGNNKAACDAAKHKAAQLGYFPHIISTAITGEAQQVGKNLAEKILINKKPRSALIAGGETTVTVQGAGKGGRNQELLLAMVPQLSKKNIAVASFATDGVDGVTDVAGAIADSHTLTRAHSLNLSINQALHNNDSYHVFSSLQDTLISGPTGTNVMDIQILLK